MSTIISDAPPAAVVRRKGQRRPVSEQQYLTTSEVAKLCGVAPRTVSKWCESGELVCHRIEADGGARRISRRNLEHFARDRRIDCDALYAPIQQILLAGVTEEAALSYRSAASIVQARLVAAPNALATGWELRSQPWDAVLVDFAFGLSGSFALLSCLADLTPIPRRVALLNEDGGADRELLERSKIAVVQKPAVAADVMAVLLRR